MFTSFGARLSMSSSFSSKASNFEGPRAVTPSTNPRDRNMAREVRTHKLQLNCKLVAPPITQPSIMPRKAKSSKQSSKKAGKARDESEDESEPPSPQIWAKMIKYGSFVGKMQLETANQEISRL